MKAATFALDETERVAKFMIWWASVSALSPKDYPEELSESEFKERYAKFCNDRGGAAAELERLRRA